MTTSWTEQDLTELDGKLDLIIERLAVSKLDNSYLLGFSFLSVLFSLSNVMLTTLLYKEVLTVTAILYFLSSFYIGYFLGAIRDNWAFRVWGWLWMALSTAEITVALTTVLLLESGTRVTPIFPYGLSLTFCSVALLLLVGFIRDVSTVTPTLKKRLTSISPVHKRYLSPFMCRLTEDHSAKPTYFALVFFLITGMILVALSYYW